MPVTEVSICNSALIKVGADTISSLSESKKSAILLNSIYTMIRDEMLRAHPWNFAIKRANLVPTATVPTYEYKYTYDLPNDCLRVLDTDADLDDDKADYVIEGRTLLTDYDLISIRYIYQNDDPSSYDPMFAEAFAWRLAVDLSVGLTQSSERQQVCMKGFQEALRQARSTDSAEGTMKGLVAETWTRSRR